MSRVFLAVEANRAFSSILGETANGETVVITWRGEPVAELVPFGGGRVDRDGLYDR